MDEEMEDTIMFTFTAVEIDLDYEFDAAGYFDFSREESLAEAREAELWFKSKGSYPPSPFVTKLILGEDILLENVTASPKTKGLENMALPQSDLDIRVDPVISAMNISNKECEGIKGRISVGLKSCILPKFNQSHQIPAGLKFYNHMIDRNLKEIPLLNHLFRGSQLLRSRQQANWPNKIKLVKWTIAVVGF